MKRISDDVLDAVSLVYQGGRPKLRICHQSWHDRRYGTGRMVHVAWLGYGPSKGKGIGLQSSWRSTKEGAVGEVVEMLEEIAKMERPYQVESSS